MKRVDSLIAKQSLDEITENYSNVVNKLIEDQTKKEEKLKKENYEIQMALYDYARMLVDYAKFHRETMIQVILDLAELYNGEEYKCEKITIMDDFDDQESVLFFCPISCDIDALDLKYSKLNLNDKFIILRREVKNMYLDFYYTDRSSDMFSSYEIHAMESIKRHSFLRDFVNYVINNRVKNNLNNFFPIDLKNLEREFIISRKDEINDIIKTINLNERMSLAEKSGSRFNKLNSIVNSDNPHKKVLEPVRGNKETEY